jgi:ribosomal protein S15P/S13E
LARTAAEAEVVNGTLLTALSGVAVAFLALLAAVFTAVQSRRGSKPDEFRAITTELRKDLETTRTDLKLTRQRLDYAVDYIRDLLEYMRRHDLEPPPVSANARYPWED